MRGAMQGAALYAAAVLGVAVSWQAPAAAEPGAAGLMAQAFPGWRDDAAGRVRTVTVPHIPGVTDARGASWETGTQRVLAAPGLVLYELHGATLQDTPMVEMALTGTNIHAVADCARRLQPLVKAPPGDTGVHDDSAPPDSHDCYAVDSNWHVGPARGQPGDLVVHYHGAISRAESYAAAPVAIDQRQVLRYEGGRYRAVEGFNPVPGI